MNSINLSKHKPRALSRLGQSGAIFGIGATEIRSKHTENLFLLTADYAIPAGMNRFMNLFPENFINVGIAEQNLIGVSAGLSNDGNNVVASAQACFLSMRCFEQVRQYLGYMQLPIVLVGVSSGFALTYFGNTHYSLEDISLLKNVKGLNLFSPSDALSALYIFFHAVSLQQPCYIRCTGGVGSPVIYDHNFDVNLGFSILVDNEEIKENKGLILSTGNVTYNALSAVNLYNENNKTKKLDLIDVYKIAPLNADILNGIENYNFVMIVEEHFENGGLASSIKELFSNEGISVPIHSVNAGNEYKIPGDYEFLIENCGLDSQGIFNRLNKLEF